MASTVEGCERLLQALAPGFESLELESLEELEVGVAWLDRADPLVCERVGAAASVFPRRREIESAAAKLGVQLDVPVEVEGIRLIADLVAAGAGLSFRGTPAKR